jgi:hypothetical protein
MKDENVLIAQFYLTEQEFNKITQHINPHQVKKPKREKVREFIRDRLKDMELRERKLIEKKRRKLLKESRKMKEGK